MIGIDVPRLAKFNGPSRIRKERRRVTSHAHTLSASAIYALRGLSEKIIGVGTFLLRDHHRIFSPFFSRSVLSRVNRVKKMNFTSESRISTLYFPLVQFLPRIKRKNRQSSCSRIVLLDYFLFLLSLFFSFPFVLFFVRSSGLTPDRCEYRALLFYRYNGTAKEREEKRNGENERERETVSV